MQKLRVNCRCGLEIEIKLNIHFDTTEFIEISCCKCQHSLFKEKAKIEDKVVTVLESKSKDKIIGNYRIIKKIGEGGMGKVFLAENTKDQEKVVVKLLKTEALPEELHSKMVHYFIREAQILKEIDHPNIVAFKSCGNFNNQPYLVTEFIDGLDLKAELAKGKIKLSQATTILYYLISALEYGHKNQLVHRDIKPDNIILFGPKKIPKLIDFGLAKSLGPHYTTLTQDGAIMGTPSYMPPEQARDAKNADHRADIYSLGATFYYMLAGKPPFYEVAHQGPRAIIMAILKKKLTPLSAIRSGLPQKIYEMVTRSMAFEVADRYPSATAFKKDLKAFFDSFK